MSSLGSEKALEIVTFQPVPEETGEQKVKTQDISSPASDTHTEGVVGEGLAWWALYRAGYLAQGRAQKSTKGILVDCLGFHVLPCPARLNFVHIHGLSSHRPRVSLASLQGLREYFCLCRPGYSLRHTPSLS